jgi:hypothetical protein
MDHNFLENDSPEEELEEDKLVKLEIMTNELFLKSFFCELIGFSMSKYPDSIQ